MYFNKKNNAGTYKRQHHRGSLRKMIKHEFLIARSQNVFDVSWHESAALTGVTILRSDFI